MLFDAWRSRLDQAAGLCVLTLLVACGSSSDDEAGNDTDTEPAWHESARAIMQPFVDEEWTPGFSIAVIQDGKTEFLGLGRIDPSEDGAPQPDTLYELASVTKTFTGTLLALAIDRGEVTLETGIADLVPDGVTVPVMGNEPIRLKHLVTHRSGLPRDLAVESVPREPGRPHERSIDADTFYRELSKATLAFEPGSDYLYSNVGMALLARGLERASGAGYEEMLRSQVTKPLEMLDTVAEPNAEQLSRVAPPFESRDTPWVLAEPGALLGAIGVLSTGADLARWTQAQLGPPEGSLGQAIEGTQKELANTDYPDLRMGMAWKLQTWRGIEVQYHSGLWRHSAEAAVAIYPEMNLGAVVLTNSDIGEATPNLIAALMDEIRGRPWSEDPEYDWPEATPAIEVPLSTLEELEGYYRNGSGSTISSLEVHDGKLYEVDQGGRWWRLWPAAEDEYVQRGWPTATMVVERDEAGAVTGYSWLNEDGGTFFAANAKVTFTGSVVADAAGSLVRSSGVEICVLGADGAKDDTIPCTTTDDSGSYTLESLTPERPVILRLEKTGFATSLLAVDVGLRDVLDWASVLLTNGVEGFPVDLQSGKGLLNVSALSSGTKGGSGPGGLEYTNDVTISISAAGGDGPFYVGPDGAPDATATATIGGPGAWFVNLDAGEYVVTASHPTLTCRPEGDNGFGWPDDADGVRAPVLADAMTQGILFFCE